MSCQFVEKLNYERCNIKIIHKTKYVENFFIEKSMKYTNSMIIKINNIQTKYTVVTNDKNIKKLKKVYWIKEPKIK